MRQLYRFMAILAALGGAALSPPLAAQLSGGGNCQTMTMADGSKVRMCKDAQGNWVQQGGPAPAAASTRPSGFPNRTEVVWKGTYDLNVSKAAKLGNRINLGTVLKAATGGESKRLTGELDLRATITGNVVVMQVSGTDLEPGRMTGTVNGGMCRLELHNPRFDLTYVGRCNAQGFVGTIEGKSYNGWNQKGSFTTSTVQLTDLDVRDRQLAEQKAENERKAAAADAERKRQAAAAAAELAAKPNASSAQANALESAVREDSGAWAMNRYNPGSIRNVKVLRSGSTQRIRGEYTYNGGSTGWVEADVTGGQVQCLQYWDTGYCSSVRRGQASRGGSDQRTGGAVVEVLNPQSVAWKYVSRTDGVAIYTGRISKIGPNKFRAYFMWFVDEGSGRKVLVYQQEHDCSQKTDRVIAMNRSNIDSVFPQSFTMRATDWDASGNDAGTLGDAMMQVVCGTRKSSPVNIQVEFDTFFNG